MYASRGFSHGSPGKIAPGTTEIPFSLNLREPRESIVEKFYETFHGTNINIQCLLTADIPRGYLHKPLSATVEFIIESGRVDLPERPIPPEMVIVYITQDTQRHPLLPEIKTGGFRVTGKCHDLWSLGCVVLEMYTGKRPWWHTNYDLKDLNKCKEPLIPRDVSSDAKLFLMTCFAIKPAERKELLSWRCQ